MIPYMYWYPVIALHVTAKVFLTLFLPKLIKFTMVNKQTTKKERFTEETVVYEVNLTLMINIHVL